MNVDNLDHLVLTVQNITATCAFYQELLGMDVVHLPFGRSSWEAALWSTCSEPQRGDIVYMRDFVVGSCQRNERRENSTIP
jgi:catechol 2,3-dioxygenase-like lactoylglutathione lyase family enzyme